MSLPSNWNGFIQDYLDDHTHWFVPKGRKVGRENVFIIKSETEILRNEFDGKVWDSDSQELFARKMEGKGFYESQIGYPSNYSFRAREEKAVLSLLGLAWVDEDNTIHVTPVGHSFIDSNSPLDVLSFQVLKWQFWNPSVRDSEGIFKDVRVSPHLTTLNLLRRIPGHSISKDEFCLFLAKVRNDDKIEKSSGKRIYDFSTLKQIEAYRKLGLDSKRELIENLRRTKGLTNIFRTIEQDSSYMLAYLTLPPYLNLEGDRIVLTDEIHSQGMAEYWETRFAYVPFSSTAAWMEFYGDPFRGPSFEEALQIYLDKHDIEGARLTYRRARVHKTPGTEQTEEQFIRSVIQEWELEKWLVDNLDIVETGLSLYSDNQGNGRQYPAGYWAIDLLAVNKNGDFVVVELKKRLASDQAFGQLCRYAGWVRDNLAEGKQVRGMIIAKDLDEKIKYAMRAFVQDDGIFKSVTWDDLGVEFEESGRDSNGDPIIRVKRGERRNNVNNIIRIPIPDWTYNVALNICLARQRRYRHQFITKKLKDIAGDDQLLKKDIEGVYGYIGDIGACVWLGIDPKEEMRAMIIDTDLLTHRDEYDILFKGWHVDVKTEIYPDDKFDRAIIKDLKVNETYGCRLININHFLENSGSVDIYIFATVDNKDPRLAKNWIPIGWIYKDDVVKICPEPKGYSPSGARLWTKAYIIPNSELRDLKDLVDLPQKPAIKLASRSSQDKSSIDQAQYTELLKKVGLD